jgi:hypothetical protein
MPRSSATFGFAFVYALVLLMLISERPAHAYIDPGSGSLIYQTALTVLLGAGFFFRKTLASIGRFFRGRGADAAPRPEPQHQDHR